MEFLTELFQIENTALEIWGYSISYVELIGTLFGMASVYLASQVNSWTWPTGIVNEIFLFVLFFQVRLYADMFLQIYFLFVTLYGWYTWSNPTAKRKIASLSVKTRVIGLVVILIVSILAGLFVQNIHSWFPSFFPERAAYPFADSYVLVASIVATVLLARKEIETWYLWLSIDTVSVVLYLQRDIYFLSLEYFIFCGLAIYGLRNWAKEIKNG